MGLLGRLDELILANPSEWCGTSKCSVIIVIIIVVTASIIMHGNSTSIKEKELQTICYIKVPIQQNLSFPDHTQGGALTPKSLSHHCGLCPSQHSSQPKLLCIISLLIASLSPPQRGLHKGTDLVGLFMAGSPSPRMASGWFSRNSYPRSERLHPKSMRC